MHRIAYVVSAESGSELAGGPLDARRMHSLLTRPDLGACDLADSVLFEDCPSRTSFEHKLLQLIEGWKPGNQLVFYYSGHGDECNDRYHLIFGAKKRSYYPFKNLLTDLQSRGVTRTLLIVDACRSALALEEHSKRSDDLTLQEFEAPPTGIAIIASCGRHERSYELPDGRHSVFTQLLCEGIESGLGGTATVDDRIGVHDIVQYINFRLRDSSYVGYPQTAVYGVKEADRGIWVAHNLSTGRIEETVTPSRQPESTTAADLRFVYERTRKDKRACDGARVEHLDWDLVNQYVKQVCPDALAHSDRQKIAAAAGLLSPEQGILGPSLHNAAVMCFCPLPSRFLSQVRAALIVGDAGDPSGKFSASMIEGPLHEQISRLTKGTIDAIGTVSSVRRDGVREETPEIPIRVIRELVSNAVIHRDYDVHANVKVTVRREAIVVESPGGFPGDLSWEKLLQHPRSVRHNETVAYYARTQRVFEGFGIGFDVFRSYLQEQGKEAITCTVHDGDPPAVSIRVARVTRAAGRSTFSRPERDWVRGQETTSGGMTEACWPVFEFLTNFVRQVKHGVVPPPDQVRYEALSALRDAEDLARDDPATERLWYDKVKALMVYLLDYKMINTEWEGSNYWCDSPFETDPTVLDHAQSLGGELFFQDCDDMQREYELAERRDRRDKDELAEVLSLYIVCLRLGFKGQYHDRPQELADYTRRLWTRLPAYASTRGKLSFPEAYEHNAELKARYRNRWSKWARALLVLSVLPHIYWVRDLSYASITGWRGLDYVGAVARTMGESALGLGAFGVICVAVRALRRSRFVPRRRWSWFDGLPRELRFVVALAGLAALFGAAFVLRRVVCPRWPVWAVMLIISVVALVLSAIGWVLGRIFGRGKRKRNKKMADELAGDAESGRVSMDVRASIKANNDRFFGAIKDMRKNLGISVYDLPWYIVIGDSGCGKTRLINDGGLTLSLGKPEGYQLATLDFNWWFSEDAIFLDMAGRLCNPQDDADRREWDGFLESTLKGRRGIPMNGAIVCVSAENLLQDPPEKVEQDANTVLERLRDLQSKFGVTFATYLVVTKCDKVLGFMQFFDRAEANTAFKNQIFGWSRPGDFSELYEPGQFGQDFDELQQRLSEVRLRQMNDDVDEYNMGLAYTFPEEFRAFRDPLQTYVRTLFPMIKNPRATKNLIFRGVYFTSATQEGALILKRVVERLGQDSADLFAPLDVLYPSKRAYFTKDLFFRKVLPEHGLVFRDPKKVAKERRSALAWTMLAILSAASFVGIAVAAGL